MMEIQHFAFQLTFDVTDEPAYVTSSSWSTESYPFKPRMAIVNEQGSVRVRGNRVKKNGELFEAEMTVEYWSWGDYPKHQPEYVKTIRRLGRDFKAEAANAWEVRNAAS